jgi:hypothetical protein
MFCCPSHNTASTSCALLVCRALVTSVHVRNCVSVEALNDFLNASNSENRFSCLKYNSVLGRAMAQAVSRRPLTAEARVRSRVSPCVICGGQSGTGTSFSPSTSVFPCQFHSTDAPLQGKTKKTNHLHHRVVQ